MVELLTLDVCDKCGGSTGDILYVLRDCRYIKRFWFQVVQFAITALSFTLIYVTGLLLTYKISGRLFPLFLGIVFSKWLFGGCGSGGITFFLLGSWWTKQQFIWIL